MANSGLNDAKRWNVGVLEVVDFAKRKGRWGILAFIAFAKK